MRSEYTGKALAAELGMKYYDKEILAEAANYDICIDSSKLGTDGAAQLIKAFLALSAAEKNEDK